MKNNYIKLLLFLTVLFYPMVGIAGIDFPWSTTYDCDCDGNASNGDTDWNQYDDPLICDGLEKGGSWTPDQCPTYYEQIIPAANYTSGGGGKGQRHWLGDGKNNNSGGLCISFNAQQSEMWIRWYMRFQSGFAWSSLQEYKIFYFDMGESASMLLSFHNINGLRVRSFGGELYDPDGFGWQSIMGGLTSDGQWHLHEVHLKMDTNGSNGIVQWWIDEALIIDRSNFDFATAGGWSDFQILSNADSPSNGSCMPVDIDDIAINTTGYIGPLSGGNGSSPGSVISGVTLSGGKF